MTTLVALALSLLGGAPVFGPPHCNGALCVNADGTTSLSIDAAALPVSAEDELSFYAAAWKCPEFWMEMSAPGCGGSGEVPQAWKVWWAEGVVHMRVENNGSVYDYALRPTRVRSTNPNKAPGPLPRKK